MTEGFREIQFGIGPLRDNLWKAEVAYCESRVLPFFFAVQQRRQFACNVLTVVDEGLYSLNASSYLDMCVVAAQSTTHKSRSSRSVHAAYAWWLTISPTVLSLSSDNVSVTLAQCDCVREQFGADRHSLVKCPGFPTIPLHPNDLSNHPTSTQTNRYPTKV